MRVLGQWVVIGVDYEAGKVKKQRQQASHQGVAKGETLRPCDRLSTAWEGNLTCLFRLTLEELGSQIPSVGSA